MQQAWHLRLLLDCIKTSGSGLGEFSGGFSGFPCSCGVSSTLRCFPLYDLHLHWTTHLDTFPNRKWTFSLNKLKPPSSKILPLNLVHKDLTHSRIPACSLTHPFKEKDGFPELLISIGNDQLNDEKRIYLILPSSSWVVGVNIWALFEKGVLKIQSPSACGQNHLQLSQFQWRCYIFNQIMLL